MKMGDENWMLGWRGSCRLLQVIALRNQRWHGKRRGKTREQVSPLKSLPVRWRGDSAKHDPCWLPFWQKTLHHSFDEVSGFLSPKVAGWRLFCVQAEGNDFSDGHAHAGSAHTPLLTVSLLFHSIAQHLIGRNKHNTDDEGHGKGADQTLAHTRLSILLCWMDCGEQRRQTQLSLISQQNSCDGHKQMCDYTVYNSSSSQYK